MRSTYLRNFLWPHSALHFFTPAGPRIALKRISTAQSSEECSPAGDLSLYIYERATAVPLGGGETRNRECGNYGLDRSGELSRGHRSRVWSWSKYLKRALKLIEIDWLY